MAGTDHDISTLNSLIATTIDSVDGYTEAAKEDTSYTARFTANAAERRAIATQLQAEVARLGGEPQDDGTALAGAHRMFLNLKATLTGHDDKAIVNEVEAGEDHIKAKFEDALDDRELSPGVRDTIEACYTSVKRGHDEMRDLKHSLQGAN
ncbi:PA2169 family four-helix-bundle protein [Glacieibacterium frigidum]|uniref:PA2169 family four-helix-bundle protein n=1 Tax=Glacieibacterium frigidum TaxID=2593303 RepID=A0A552UG33_9SPHN|nr:PA2169 family four-helix-bundle protein [Glacieibacterium frigidum]TRW17182.1 PA2169 family four-helix-bundle protein [Glacieibacterium frigidum]